MSGFTRLKIARLPAQLLLLALPLWMAVAAYNARFSVEAQQPQVGEVDSQAARGQAASAGAAAPVAIDRNKRDVVRTVDAGANSSRDPLAMTVVRPKQGSVQAESVPVSNTADVGSETVAGNTAPELLIDGDDVVVQAVSRSVIEPMPNDEQAEPLGLSKEAEVGALIERLSGPVTSATPEAATTSDSAVKGSDWVSAQLDTSFVIQLESSANYAVMQKQALRHADAEPLAIYPFAVSRDGEVIYGMSHGLYDTLAEAKQASAGLSDNLLRFGSWIRQVKDIKQQIQSIDQGLAE